MFFSIALISTMALLANGQTPFCPLEKDGNRCRSVRLDYYFFSLNRNLDFTIQASLVIRGRYVPLFWTANTEFADKKTHFD